MTRNDYTGNKSPFVVAALENMLATFSAKDMQKAVIELQKTHRAKPYPFSGLCAPDEAVKISEDIFNGSLRWKIKGWCWINSCSKEEQKGFLTEEDAHEAGRNMRICYCGNDYRWAVSPYIKEAGNV